MEEQCKQCEKVVTATTQGQLDHNMAVHIMSKHKTEAKLIKENKKTEN